jgi:hypothetical protein
MTLDVDEFIRLIHVLPDGFHRIRHCGLFANANRASNIALACQQRRRAMSAMAPKRVTQTKSGTLVLAAAGVWLSSRPSSPVASPSFDPSHNPARQLVTNTLLSPSLVTAPLRRRDLTGDARQ